MEEEVVALRSGVVYELGLRTTVGDYTADRARFEQTIAGFCFSPLLSG